MELNQKPINSKDILLYAENVCTPREKDATEIFLEAAGDSYIIKNKLYPIIEAKLSTPIGDRKFKDIVGRFIDRNNDRLKTPGPLYMIAFTDTDKADFFNIFEISPEDIIKLVIEITSSINASDFKYLKQNPPINEAMIKDLMMQMGRKPNQKQINQMMKSMSKYM